MILSFLQSRSGKEVLINKGSPHAHRGKLLRVEEDYVVIQARDGREIFYQTEHMKSISMDTYSEPMTPSATGTPVSQADDAQNFDEVLHRLRYYGVDINQGSPEAQQGILMRVFEDSVLVIAQHHLIQVMKRHIVTISLRRVEKVESEAHQASSGKREQHAEKREEATTADDDPVQEKQPITVPEDIKQADPQASSIPITIQSPERLTASVEERDQSQAIPIPAASLAVEPLIPEEQNVYSLEDQRSDQPQVRRRSKRSPMSRRKGRTRGKMKTRTVIIKSKVRLAILSSVRRYSKLHTPPPAALRSSSVRDVLIYRKRSSSKPRLSQLFIASPLVYAPYYPRKKALY